MAMVAVHLSANVFGCAFQDAGLSQALRASSRAACSPGLPENPKAKTKLMAAGGR
jgi:hypothetical protein